MSDRNVETQKGNKPKNKAQKPEAQQPEQTTGTSVAVIESEKPKQEIPEDVRDAALTILAEHMGKTVEEIQDMLNKSEVPDDKLSGAINRVLNHKPAENHDADEVNEEQVEAAEGSALSENLQGKALEIHNIFTARIKRVKETKGDGPAKKFETERQKLVAMSAFFENHADINLLGLDKLAIYAIQKVRKLISGDIDGFTMTLLQNVEPLKKAKVPFTAELQQAAMSMSVAKNAKDKDGVKALVVTRDCDPATASTQASSSRAALCFLGLAHETKGRNQALEVNTGHPIWKEKVRPLLNALAKQQAKA